MAQRRVGWAVVEVDDENKPKNIVRLGSRIIPMSQDILGKFDAGVSVSQTAERTGYRGVRRLRERHLLRRERLHRVLYLLGFLPAHYDNSLGWDKTDNKTYGKFLFGTEPKLAWRKTEEGKPEFLFQHSFDEMIEDFKMNQPQLLEPNANNQLPLIPHDWTIYYLRKKALTKPITKEELAWILLNFNQKRGYYQLRGEEEENPNKLVEFHALKVVNVIADESQKEKTDIWYSIVLENGWIYRRSNKNPLFDWVGKIKEFIVTTDLNDNGTPKTDKDGKEKRSFRAPSEDDWMLLKEKTQTEINRSHKTVGCYIYDTILQNPNQKVRGKLIRTIERKYYKEELILILKKQEEFHAELKNKELYDACLTELYPHNKAHYENIASRDFTYLFVNDIILYQRPLKSKKSLISDCPYESHLFMKDGEKQSVPLKCIAKSNPLFQEFRLWQFLQNLRIYACGDKEENGKLKIDADVTPDFLPSKDAYVALFEWLNDKKEIKQDTLLQSFFKIKKEKGEDKLPYRWNYVEDKEYPCNETHAQMLAYLAKCGIGREFLTKENEMSLWHILYSVESKDEVVKALNTFAKKYNLNEMFAETFQKFPPFKKEYGSYSEKAIKKLLPLMRIGKCWNENAFDSQTRQRIENIMTGEYDETIRNRVREKAIKLTEISHFQGLPTWLACYIVYDRHSEAGSIVNWKSPQDIELYLRDFKQHSLRNPIVEQVITETLRTVKDIWRAYGNFSEIHIELGREMKNPADKRADMTKKISENEDTNLRIKSLLMELNNDPNVENVRPYSPGQQELLKIYEEGVLNAAMDLPEDIAKISKMNQPNQSQLTRYKLWLEQKYRSPYTGNVISLGKLFTPAYEIEHIIPQSRYFDDSLSNKVICESEVNTLKDRMLGYEFIQKHGGTIIREDLAVLSTNEYKELVRKDYRENRTKMKKLLMEDIPESFIERQMNDSRYISKMIAGLLSNIVREENEQETISKNIIPCTGGVTSTLKRDWGLNDIWNRIVQQRFERLNKITQTSNFGEWKDNRFQIQMPLELQKGFNKKRIDHRHHAMDALIIACATRSHIKYINNYYAHKKEEKKRYDLRKTLRKTEEKEIERIENGQKIRKKIEVAKEFYKPWETFTQDAQGSLENIIVSFKSNLRVINKTTNKYQIYEEGKKIIRLQKERDNRAIRKPLHKDTIFGKVSLRKQKTVKLSIALENWKAITDKELKLKIRKLIIDYGNYDAKIFLRYFKDREYKLNDKDISRVEIYYFDTGNAATRKNIDIKFNAKKIASITDTGIQKILLNHLETKEGNPEWAFSPEGIDEMNKNIKVLNEGKNHQPIFKVRIYESIEHKFRVGGTGNKKEKYVEAADGTNLFFAVYQCEDGKRIYKTIPLYVAIEQRKQGESPVPEIQSIGGQEVRLLFSLSPNDLVYVPTEEEQENPHLVDIKNLTREQLKRIYKFVSCTRCEGYFVPNAYAFPIMKNEMGFNNKNERMIELSKGHTVYAKDIGVVKPIQIKSCCWKLIVNRLGLIIGCKK
ncbi:CRISPR-associated endonuclease Cas9 [termite gut metagenome]|uniref:CRISPR-associated endonuclease Cas9 n=1 Tax=termite gut metagenome TaxID=433724 RepID=A0A5J4RF84_9ZZZZ